MQLNWKKLLSASLVLSFALTSGCTKKNSNEIVVGHFGSMTGADATFGQSTDEGIRLAIDEVNAAGGVNGKKIKRMEKARIIFKVGVALLENLSMDNL